LEGTLYRKALGSLVLSGLDLVLCISALLLGFIFRSGWSFILFTIVLPACLLVTLVYLVLDFVLGRSRKQLATALLLLLPTIATQIWFYRNLDL
jgi:hypothetical protein